MDAVSWHARTRMDSRLAIDACYATILGCAPRALRAPGWERIVAHDSGGPGACAYGLRQEVFLLAPLASGRAEFEEEPAGPGGVAALAPTIAARAGDLFAIEPRAFFQPAPLLRLDRLVRESVTRPLAPGCEPSLTVWYACPADSIPPVGPWAEWIERLDPATERSPHGRALLARRTGVALVARVRDSIVASCGLRALSTGVWELIPPELTASAQGLFVARPESLLRALLARATRAAFDAGAVPICFTSYRAVALRRRLMACGYHPYARASAYASLAPLNV